MIPHGQASRDCFNLELRHHQYAEIIAIFLIYIYTDGANIYSFLKMGK